MPSLLSLSSAMVSFTPLPFGSEMNGLLPCNFHIEYEANKMQTTWYCKEQKAVQTTFPMVKT